ncbi:MAG: zinc ribbon domain-containing protein [Chloroflexi bacterium]|nr:zinc ribbon domain-containing protein [Chloroflexota bacterium]
MPTYPYICEDCGKPFSITLSYREYEKHKVRCAYCQSEKVTRRISRVRFARSEESRLDALADPAMLAGLEDDPRAMAKMMRTMSSEMGDEIGEDIGPEFDEVVDRLEAGQKPEDIEKEMPDLGDAPGMGGDIGI